MMGAVLLAYGASVAIGNFWGGRLADTWGPVFALKPIFAALAGVLLLLTFTPANKVLVLPTDLALGAVAFGNVPVLQVYVVKQAEGFDAYPVNVASGINIAAFNLGVAGGAYIGWLIVIHLGLMQTPWRAALVVLLALSFTALSGELDRRETMRLQETGVEPSLCKAAA